MREREGERKRTEIERNERGCGRRGNEVIIGIIHNTTWDVHARGCTNLQECPWFSECPSQVSWPSVSEADLGCDLNNKHKAHSDIHVHTNIHT